MIPRLRKFSLKAHVEGSQNSQIGGKMSWYCHSAKSFFGLNRGMWNSGTLQFLSFSSWKHPLAVGRTICPAVCECKPINTEICPLIGRAAITHQWAVVQESRGEVGVEAERQDVPFSGAESHFIIWRGKGNSELQGLQTSGSVSGEIIKLVLNCRLSLRTNLWVSSRDPYRSAMPHRGHELWTHHSPDPPWWDGNGVISEIHLQRQRDFELISSSKKYVLFTEKPGLTYIFASGLGFIVHNLNVSKWHIRNICKMTLDTAGYRSHRHI